MDKRKSAVPQWPGLNSAEGKRLVADYEASGLSQREFCRRRGISETTLKRRRRRVRGTGSKAADATPWVNVEVRPATAGADSGVILWLEGGRRIEVGRGFDEQTLVALLAVLERS